ncbi:hypothetical protein D3C85_1858550 [compost metagenome]
MVAVGKAQRLRQRAGIHVAQGAGVRLAGIAAQRDHHEITLEQALDRLGQGADMVL